MFGSVKPSPAALVRAALNSFESRCLFSTKKKNPSGWMGFFLCKDYKKDIFGRFAYDFELSQNILSFLI